MERSTITSPALINRRTAIGGAVVALTPLLFPGRLMAQGKPKDSFVVLLKGIYQPVVHGPNLGLSTVDLSDGSYSTTKIYPVSGTPGNNDVSKIIGDFYVQFTGDLCAYHVPGFVLDAVHRRAGSRVRRRRAGWAVHGRNCRTQHTRGDRGLSIVRWWSQSHGRQAALPRLRRRRRILLLLHQQSINNLSARSLPPKGADPTTLLGTSALAGVPLLAPNSRKLRKCSRVSHRCSGN